LSFTFDDIKKIILNYSKKHNKEFERLFHGRGGLYKEFEYLCIDSINKVLFVTVYKKISPSQQNDLYNLLKSIYEIDIWETIIIQNRFEQKAPSKVLFGILPNECFAYEHKLKYHINLIQNQNIGFFGDMKNGREYIIQNSKDKNILNLFSYTCAFSVCAKSAGAKQVVNVDMSKSALSTGRANHHLNNQDTKNIHFLPYNILKSWSKIKKYAPYDLIIIDPPSFQKGSFAATKDYEKIIKRLPQLASSNCTVLSALNAPELDIEFIKNLFKIHCHQFKYIKQLDNPITYPNTNKQKALKNLIFRYNGE
jgi:23S rRNA (cytosine1962-C5)-methyltransferase